jgi:pimeloyl-ACP methyl ester carboxylesterase
MAKTTRKEQARAIIGILSLATFGIIAGVSRLGAQAIAPELEPNAVKRYMFSCGFAAEVRAAMETRGITLKSQPLAPAPGGRTVFVGAYKNGIENPYVIENEGGKLHVYIDLRRPQYPVGLLPYSNQEVVFDNPEAGLSFVGTLSYPQKGGPFPAVVLVAGSGAHTRDEMVSLHKIFLVLADSLTRRGLAVLRYDKRGVGMSGGKADPQSTTDDYASDARAAVRFLRLQPGIDPARVGIIGHSEGGIIAPMVAADNPEVAFIVLMAGTGLSGMDVQILQENALGRARGADERVIQANDRQNRAVFPMIIATKDNAEAIKKFRASEREVLTAEERKLMGIPDEPLPDEAYTAYLTPWFRRFLELDPRPYLEKVKCPVLALNGGKDLQVLPDENLGEIDKALKRGGNTRFVVRRLGNLNHMFQTAPTGLPDEYRNIEETIAPFVLDMISAWILSLSK